MHALLKVLTDTVFTLAIVVVITLGFYVGRRRRFTGYVGYLGLRKTTRRACGLALAVGLVNAAISVCTGDELWTVILGAEAAREWKASPNTTGNQLLATGVTGSLLIVAALFKGLVQTALIEEIFFRGFIAKRLTNWLGFHLGNGVQATIFAGMHMAFPFLLGMDGAVYVALVFGVMTGALAWVMGYLNERQGAGSILPGWIVHGVGNGVAYVAAVA